MRETRNAYRILMGKPAGKRPLGSPRCRWMDSIKMDLRGIGWDGMDWIDLAQIVTSGGFFEHGIEPLGLIKCWEDLE
jgi:hypothetical protein